MPGAMGLAHEAVRRAEACGAEVLRARVTLGAALLYEGRLGWDVLCREVLDDAAAVGDVGIACNVAFHLVSGLGFMGRLDDAIELGTEMLATSSQAGLESWHTHFAAAGAFHRALSGTDRDWVLRHAPELLERWPAFRNRSQIAVALAVVHLDGDRLGEAEAVVEQLGQFAASDEERAFAAWSAAETAWQRRDGAAVRDQVLASRACGEAYFGLRSVVEVIGAHAAVESGDRIDVDLATSNMPVLWPLIHEVEGLSRWEDGDVTGAVRELDLAADRWRSVRMRRWAVRAALAAAELAQRSGRRDRAARRAAAIEEARAAGLHGLLTRVRRARRRADAEGGRGPATHRRGARIEGDRRPPRGVAADGRRPRRVRLPQARRSHPPRGGGPRGGRAAVTGRPLVVLVDDDPERRAHDLVPGRSVVAGLAVPSEPYDLRGDAVRAATIRSAADINDALGAVVRGASLVLAVDGVDRGAFVDELRRVADVEVVASPAPRVAALLDEDRALLMALASGTSVSDAARHLGLSLRTAHRRLARARAALDAATTTEAVLAVSRLDHR